MKTIEGACKTIPPQKCAGPGQGVLVLAHMYKIDRFDVNGVVSFKCNWHRQQIDRFMYIVMFQFSAIGIYIKMMEFRYTVLYHLSVIDI